MPKMPIPDDWNGLDWGCCVIEWPSSEQWMAIFLGLITYPSVGRFWDERSGLVVDAQSVGREIISRNICLWENSTMGCLEDVITAINDLTGVINNVYSNANCGGCNGSGGAGFSAETPSSFVDDGFNHPDGYADRAGYLDAKCRLAAHLVDVLISDLKRLRIVNVSSMTLQAAVALLTTTIFTPVPFDEIFGLAALILALISAAVDAYVGTLDELIGELEDHFDICVLYTASDVGEAKSGFDGWVDGLTLTYPLLAKPFLKAFVGTNNLNPLFADKPTDIDIAQLPEADCSSCDDPDNCALSFLFGSETSPGTLSSAFNAGPGLHYIQFQRASGPNHLGMTFSNRTGYTPTAFNDFNLGDGDFYGVDFTYAADDLPSGEACFDWAILTSTTAFTIDYECVALSDCP